VYFFTDLEKTRLYILIIYTLIILYIFAYFICASQMFILTWWSMKEMCVCPYRWCINSCEWNFLLKINHSQETAYVGPRIVRQSFEEDIDKQKRALYLWDCSTFLGIFIYDWRSYAFRDMSLVDVRTNSNFTSVACIYSICIMVNCWS